MPRHDEEDEEAWEEEEDGYVEAPEAAALSVEERVALAIAYNQGQKVGTQGLWQTYQRTFLKCWQLAFGQPFKGPLTAVLGTQFWQKMADGHHIQLNATAAAARLGGGSADESKRAPPYPRELVRHAQTCMHARAARMHACVIGAGSY
jgi:hypothetical protein